MDLRLSRLPMFIKTVQQTRLNNTSLKKNSAALDSFNCIYFMLLNRKMVCIFSTKTWTVTITKVQPRWKKNQYFHTSNYIQN